MNTGTIQHKESLCWEIPYTVLFQSNQKSTNKKTLIVIPQETAQFDRKKAIELLTLPGEFLSFELARVHVRVLELQSRKEWEAYCKSGKKPKNIPAVPDVFFKGEYQGMADWLGYEFWPYEACRAWVQAHVVPLGIESSYDWQHKLEKSSLPNYIPRDPYEFFTKIGTWISWEDFLGINLNRNNPRRKGILKSKKGIKIIQQELVPLGVTSSTLYYRYMDKLRKEDPTHPYLQIFPSNPNITWKKSWNKILGNKNKQFSKKKVWSHKKAKDWVQLNLVIPHKINTQQKWQVYLRGEYPKAPTLPKEIPRELTKVYKKRGTWRGYGTFFGTNNKRPGYKKYWSSEKAQRWISRKISKDKVYNTTTWRNYKSGKIPGLPPLPTQIPRCPEVVYKTSLTKWLKMETSNKAVA